MKQKIKTMIAAATLSLISLCSFAQDESPVVPAWSSDKGYWVTKSNIHSPLQHTIWFYTNEGILVYKETLTGVKLNIAKRKVKMKLKKVLEASIMSWEKNRTSQEETALVKTILQ